MEIDRNGLEVLDRCECLRLLASCTLGRIAISSSALPSILPINYWLDPEQATVVFAATTGSSLDLAASNAVVAFEVDEVDPFDRSGWSVLVTGIARHLVPDGLIRVPEPRLLRWAPEGEGVFLAISTELISGRRIHRR